MNTAFLYLDELQPDRRKGPGRDYAAYGGVLIPTEVAAELRKSLIKIYLEASRGAISPQNPPHSLSLPGETDRAKLHFARSLNELLFKYQIIIFIHGFTGNSPLSVEDIFEHQLITAFSGIERMVSSFIQHSQLNLAIFPFVELRPPAKGAAQSVSAKLIERYIFRATDEDFGEVYLHWNDVAFFSKLSWLGYLADYALYMRSRNLMKFFGRVETEFGSLLSELAGDLNTIAIENWVPIDAAGDGRYEWSSAISCRFGPLTKTLR